MTNLLVKNGKARTTERPNMKWYGIRTKLEGRTSMDKTGFVTFQASPHNIRTWQSIYPEATVDNQDAEKAAEKEFFATNRPKFRLKRDQLPHQSVAHNKLKDKVYMAVFGDVGSGKSKILTDLAVNHYCEGRIDAMVIVAINDLVINQWHDSQLPRDIDEAIPYRSWVWKKTKKAMADYEALKDFEGFQIITINIDALRTDKGVNHVLDFIKHHKGRVLFAVDESQTIKSLNAGRSKNARRLALMCDLRSILSGTPIAVDLTDYFAQYKLLDENIIGHKYLGSFKSEYCVTRWNGFADEIVGHKNEEKLYALTEPYTFRISKAELGFRDYDDEFEFVLGPEEKKHYNELKKTFMTQLENGEFLTAENALAATVRMQQVSNGFLPMEDGTFQMLECSRAKALRDWLELVPDEKIVLWCRFKLDSQILMEQFKGEILDISGNVDPTLRYENIQRFIHEKDKRFVVGTPAAAGVGVDGLQTVTNRAVFYSNSYNAIDFWQARARTSRFGGDMAAFYTTLIAKGTVDRRILSNLQKKEQMSKYMLDDLREMFDG